MNGQPPPPHGRTDQSRAVGDDDQESEIDVNLESGSEFTPSEGDGGEDSQQTQRRRFLRRRSAPDLEGELKFFTVDIDFERDADLGLKLKGGIADAGPDLGLFIADIAANSTADRCGQLMKGDRIISVNGKSLEGVPNNIAVSLLKAAMAEGHILFEIGRINPAENVRVKASPVSMESHRRSHVSATSDSIFSSDAESETSSQARRRRRRMLPRPPSSNLSSLESRQSTPAASRRQRGSISASRTTSRTSAQSGTSVSPTTATSIPFTASESQRTFSSPGSSSARALARPRPHSVTLRRVCMVLSGNGLGIKLRSSREHPNEFVITVTPDGDASNAGIVSGMILESINGRQVTHMSLAEAREELARISSIRDTSPVSVTLNSVQGKPFGISLCEEAEKAGVRISSIVPGSVAAIDKTLQAGDVIASINGMNAANLTTVDLKRIIQSCRLSGDPLTITARRDSAIVGTYFAEDTDVSVDSASIVEADYPVASKKYRKHRGQQGRQPFTIMMNAMAQELTPEQRRRVREEIEPDEDGMVDVRQFRFVVESVLDDPADSDGGDRGYTRDNRLEPLTDTKKTIFERRIRALTQRTQLYKQDLLDANEKIRALEKDNARLKASASAAKSSTSKATRVERDYEEIVALLEAEVAHLRSQLTSGPDRKDDQLITLRQRVVVLGAQLNKAVKAKQIVENACDKYRQLINGVQRRILNAHVNPLAKSIRERREQLLRHNNVAINTNLEDDPRAALSSHGRKSHNMPPLQGQGQGQSQGRLQGIASRVSNGSTESGDVWQAGDVCTAPCALLNGRVIEGVIQEFSDDFENVIVLFKRSETGRSDDTIEIVSVDAVHVSDPMMRRLPAVSVANAVAPVGYGTAAKGIMATGRRNSSTGPYEFETPVTEREIEIVERCQAACKEVTAILQEQPLPYGWEEAYTEAGLKYYVDHTTQTTSWNHPLSGVASTEALESLPEKWA